MAELLEDDFISTDRFEVLRRLGKGGMGVVYEVVDREHEEHVALKTLKRLSANAVLRFKNEFRALQDLHHPNLVRLGELFERRGKWFFTMELIEGVTLLDYVRSDGGRPDAAPQSEDRGETPTLPTDGDDQEEEPAKKQLPRAYDEERLRSVLAQLASAICALHKTQQVHRDIKPSNILVTPGGQVKLLDFGLVTESPEKRIWADDHLVGTVSYMAPEQAAQKPVGPAADWYSVGVLLYQALTGKLPVRGTTEEVLFLKQAIEPVAPSQIATVPQDLEELCMALLRIDPASRPDGAEVLRRLAAPDVDTGRVSRTLFVGRGPELAALDGAFAAMRAGKRVAVLVDGESGVGKSAIAQRFVQGLRRDHAGTVTLLGRCYERESVPYKAVDGAIDSLTRYLTTLPSISVGKLLPEHMGLVGKVFPVMRRVEAVARATRPPDNIDPVVLRARLFTAFRELWQRVARSVPLVVLIDDLQWADEESLALLDEILREPEAPPLLLVATVRAASKNEVGFRNVQDLAARIGGDVRTIHVGTLPREDAFALVCSLAEGTSVDEGPDASAIAEAAGGHPLFIDELVRQRRTNKRAGGPERLDEVLYARASALEPAARHVLSIVALAGTPLAQETAARAAEMDFSALARIVTPLRAQNLVRTMGVRRSDLVEPYHDRVREAVVERLPPDERRKLHGRLALALEASGEADPEALAVHFEGAGDRNRASEYAESAADDAAQKLAFDRAARLFRRALELRPREASESSVIHTKLGDALANAGRGAEAARAYLTAVEGARPDDVLDLRRRVAEQLLRSGLIDEGVEQLRVVLASIGMTLPRTPWTAVASFLFRRVQVRLRGIAFQERRAEDVPPEELVRVDICWSAGIALGMVDTVRGAHFQARGLLLALQVGEAHRVARALAGEAGFAAAAGRDGEGPRGAAAGRGEGDGGEGGAPVRARVGGARGGHRDVPARRVPALLRGVGAREGDARRVHRRRVGARDGGPLRDPLGVLPRPDEGPDPPRRARAPRGGRARRSVREHVRALGARDHVVARARRRGGRAPRGGRHDPAVVAARLLPRALLVLHRERADRSLRGGGGAHVRARDGGVAGAHAVLAPAQHPDRPRGGAAPAGARGGRARHGGGAGAPGLAPQARRARRGEAGGGGDRVRDAARDGDPGRGDVPAARSGGGREAPGGGCARLRGGGHAALRRGGAPPARGAHGRRGGGRGDRGVDAERGHPVARSHGRDARARPPGPAAVTNLLW